MLRSPFPIPRAAAALLALALVLAACGQQAAGPATDGEAAAGARPPGAGDEEPADRPPHEGTVTRKARTGDEAAPAEQGHEPQDGQPRGTTAADPAAEEDPDPAAEPGRQVGENAWTPFASVAGIELHHPSARVERVGFHEANHDGAQSLEVAPGAIAPMTLDGRDRETDARSAADVVVDPEVEIRAPVTGTVVRAGTYVLYCDHSDDYVVVEPDARPGWEVKLLHIDGVRVTQGERVVAGETVLAPRATQLPFESQVDEHTAEPSWPHVHIEVVDPSIPDEPSGGGC